MKRLGFSIFLIILCCGLWAQNIPVALNYTKVYDYIDELITDGIVVNQTALRPYTRNQIADMLMQAQKADSLLSNRQRNELKFYLNEFALENEMMVDNYIQYEIVCAIASS